MFGGKTIVDGTTQLVKSYLFDTIDKERLRIVYIFPIAIYNTILVSCRDFLKTKVWDATGYRPQFDSWWCQWCENLLEYTRHVTS